MKNQLITLLTLALLSFTTQADSVWKVSKGSDALYIGGTVHLLKPSDFPLPSGYETAYAASDSLLFETDINAIASPAFGQKMMQKAMLTDGKTLKDVLSEKTLADLNAHIISRGMPAQNFQGFKPGFLSITLSIMELNRLGINAQGVDAYFAAKAKADKKQIGWFESPEEQLAFIEKLGQGIEDEIISHTLKDMVNIAQYIELLMDAWRDGDRTELIAVGISDMQKDYPSVYQDLLVNRNNNWMPKIKQLFSNDKKEFILVGALHLVGNDGVLTQLEKAGYKVEKVTK